MTPLSLPFPECLTRALDASSEGVLIVDSGGRIAFVNAASDSILASGKEQLLGVPVGDVFPNWKELEGGISVDNCEGAVCQSIVKGVGGGDVRVRVRLVPLGDAAHVAIWFHIPQDVQAISTIDNGECPSSRSEGLLGMVGSMAKVGGWVLDVSGYSVDWTDEVYRIHELPVGQQPTVEEAIDFYLPEDREKLRANLSRAIEEGESYDEEYGFVTAKGNLRRVHAHCRPQFEAGRVVRLVGTFQDVTERWMGENQLRAERNFSRAILENAGALVVVLDADGCIEQFNRAAEELSGCTFQEVQGKPPWDAVIPVDEAEQVRREAFEALKNDPESLSGSYRNNWQTKSGEKRLIEWFNTVLLDSSGRLDHVVAVGVDVTERSIAEKALRASESAARESEAKFKGLVVASSQVVWTTDREGVVFEDSPSWRAFTGQSNEDWLSNKWIDLLHPDDRARVYDEWRRSVSSGEKIETDYRIRHVSGEWRWMSVRGVPILNMDGTVRVWVGMNIDISREREEEIERSNRDRRLMALNNMLVELAQARVIYSGDVDAACRQIVSSCSSVMNVARASIWRVEKSGSVMWCKYLFLQGAGFVGNDLRLVAADYPNYFQALATGRYIDASDARNDPRTSEFTEGYLKPLGITSMLDVCFYVEGRIAGLICLEHVDTPRAWMADEIVAVSAMANAAEIAHETANRRVAADALRASEERFRQVMENIQEVFWMFGIEENGMLYVSPAFESVWGRNCETLLKSSSIWLEAIHPDDRDRVAEAAKTKQIAGTYNEEFRIVRPDGTICWIHDRAFPISARDGRVYRIAGVAEDITERRKLEEQLRQSQKMEGIGQLAGGVAHDFNNILAGIILEIELVPGLDILPESAREALRNVRSLADRAAKLTRQLLLFSRRQVMQVRPVDLNATVSDLSRMLKRVLGEPVDFELKLHADRLGIVADTGMLDQVLMNLALNARDAMPKGGRLTITTSMRVVGADDLTTLPELLPGPYASMEVDDTGCGISKSDLTRVFEPFYTTKEPGKGTGLGLATVFGVVKQHGGAITVRSLVGNGSTFTILLPMKEAKERASQKPSAKDSPSGSETILLVEDEPAVRRVTERLLRRRGYSVIVAANGVEALEIWKEKSDEIDLLLTDLVMPGGIDGKDLAERLVSAKSGLKVVFTSGYSPEFAGRNLMLEEGVNFIRKPAPMRQILTTVRRCLDS